MEILSHVTEKRAIGWSEVVKRLWDEERRTEGIETVIAQEARPAYGSMYGMNKTTVYIPDELKRSLTRTAAARGCSEAELIRQALRDMTARAAPPRPRLPLFRSRKARLAERTDAALAGFGEA